jgi:hypothetical protein
MSGERQQASWSWKSWAMAVALLVVSVLAWFEGRLLLFLYRESPVGDVVSIASEAAFVVSLIWILILIKPLLWPRR